MIEIGIKEISTAILQPVINDIYTSSKKVLKHGFVKWGERTYHTKIKNKISSIEKLKTFWSGDQEVFIADFYHPSRINLDGKSTQCSYLSDLPAGNIVIEGIIGNGKSIFIRNLATSHIRSNVGRDFPIFIELRMLSEKVSLELAIRKYLEEVNIDGYDDDVFEFVFNSGKFVLFLDAFDELESSIEKDVISEIEHLSKKYDKTRIIITTRPWSSIQKSSGFRVLKISKLTKNDYASFLQKLGIDVEISQGIRLAINESPSNISELITTPLMLILVVIAYRSNKKIPSNMPDFFDLLFRCVISGHDDAKGILQRNFDSSLTELQIQELFEAFCFLCTHKNKIRSISTSDFDEIYLEATKRVNFTPCDPGLFRKDICKVACLIVADGYENWSFLHQSVVDYYSASFVKKSIEKFSKRFYDEIAPDKEKWHEALDFLQLIDTYRFHSYFSVKEINKCIDEIIELEKSIFDSSMLERYISKNGSNIRVFIEKPNENGDVVKIINFIFFSNRFYLKKNSYYFNEKLKMLLKNEKIIDISNFEKYFLHQYQELDAVPISINQYIKFFGYKGVASAISLLREKLIEELTEVERSISFFESKEDILDFNI